MSEQEHFGVEGVLLYYHFTPLSTRQPEEQQWYIQSCSKLSLKGRVRVARDGVNATLGGPYTHLQEHASQVSKRYNSTSIDFKLTKSTGRKNEKCVTESKFDQLTVDVVKEVVSIGLDDLLNADGDVTAAPITARHASAIEFHELLQNAAVDKEKETVLVDCRNLYETRIGRFEADGVTSLDPGTRAFSDLPAWFESNSHKLAGKRVLMCCTGGVRCERASAYLQTLGKCFEGEDDVVQLYGGIERYLQQYGGTGFFKGKNFVFDERGDVEGLVEEGEGASGGGGSGSGGGVVCGTCCVCTAPWGDYGARARCGLCRMLVLLCDDCAKTKAQNEEEEGKEPADDGDGKILEENNNDDETRLTTLRCEMCQKRRNDTANIILTSASSGGGLPHQHPTPTRARILCLHGFRQTARNFQRRTFQLRKRLKHVAEFVFIDAPHTLPDIFSSRQEQEEKEKQGDDEDDEDTREEKTEEVPNNHNNNEWEQKLLRRGWLLIPKQYENPEYIPENDELDHEQYLRQTAGLKESLDTIDKVLDTQGPWDGILGFSQGASVAALLAARECRQRPQKEERRFKFVICCSGYPSPLSKEVGLTAETIPMPSLHVYGTGRQDRQISEPESKSLWEQFDCTQRVLLRHSGGHFIPATRLATARIAEFIAWASER